MPPVNREFSGDRMDPIGGADTGASDADAAQDRACRIRALGAQIARRSAELNRRLA